MHQGKQNLKRKYREIKEQMEYIVDDKPWTWLCRETKKEKQSPSLLQCIKRREPK